jgi:hypothetical protein
MPTLLNDAPIFNYPTPLVLPDGSALTGPDGHAISALRNQIIMWASLLPEGQPVNRAKLKRFAIVVDSAFSDTCLLREEHLLHWANTRYRQLLPATLGLYQHQIALAKGIRFLKFRANLLVYPNLRGQRDVPDPTVSPVELQFPSGVAVWRASVPYDDRTRLPLFGVQGIREAAVKFEIDAGATPMVARMST